jgi:peptidoglycan/xylan/chitin deacetylase (PgdA/CDA1 family)
MHCPFRSVQEAVKAKVVISVDVEPSIAGTFVDPHGSTPILDEPIWGEVGGRSEALGFLIRTLEKHAISATFFVETVHTTYFDSGRMGVYAARLAAAGFDVQLHLHPCWLTFRDGRPDLANKVSDNCQDLDMDRLVGIIERGSDQISEWVGLRPVGMRTGNFATERNVFTAMGRAGLRCASNICISAHPPQEAELRLCGGAAEIEGIVEIPVTCFADSGPVGRGRFRPAQITSCTFAEQRHLLEEIRRQGGGIVMIVTHPFEFLKRADARYSAMRPNKLVQRRFERLCQFLASRRDQFEVTTLAAASECLQELGTARTVHGSAIRSLCRSAANFINDRI